MLKTPLLCALLLFGLSACRTVPIVTIPPASCAKLIPQDWKQGVDRTPIPDAALDQPLLEQVKSWAAAFVGASGDTTKADGRTRDTISIMENCEAMVNAARPK